MSSFVKQVHFVASMVMVVAMPVCAGVVDGDIGGKILTGGEKKVMILSANGEVEWEHPSGLAHDTWMLANGNVLFADGAAVTEVTPGHREVFRYKSKEQKGGGTYACQRLENGNTLIGENSTGKVLEVDPSGAVVFELQTSPATIGQHHNERMVRKLKNGNYLVCHSGAHIVKEYTPKGDVVLELKIPNLAFSAIRTDKGTTIVGALNKIVEFDVTGRVVWEFGNTDIPGLKITNMTGLQLLSNGNIVTGCYRAYDKEEGCGLLEITRDRKLVWRLCAPKLAGTMMPVQKLDQNGKPLPGDCLR